MKKTDDEAVATLRSSSVVYKVVRAKWAKGQGMESLTLSVYFKRLNVNTPFVVVTFSRYRPLTGAAMR